MTMTVYQARLGASVRKTHPESGFRTAGQEAHGEEKEVEEEGARLKQGGGGGAHREWGQVGHRASTRSVG
jgi:hypothetical protein